MKPNQQSNEEQIDIEAIANRLIELSRKGAFNRKTGMTESLNRLKPALLEARKRKASFAALSRYLKDNGIPVSEPTLRNYLKPKARTKPIAAHSPRTASKAGSENQATPQAPTDAAETTTKAKPPRLSSF